MSKNANIPSILKSMRRIVVVGLSSRPDRPSHDVAAYLQRAGFEVVPVNPAESGEILGQKVYPDLASVPGDIDVVDVFRRSDAVLPVAEEAVKRGGIRSFWMQLGISSAEARELLERHDITVVEDHCLKVEHQLHR
jgi:predicted CoA-binding protein